jgi:hypothetical protein
LRQLGKYAPAGIFYPASGWAEFAAQRKFLPSCGGKYFHFEEKTWRFCWKNSGEKTCLRKD